MELPDYKMVQGGNTRVNMSAGAASQVGKAFASMGKDLEDAGMEVSGLFEEAERQHNIGKMADLQLELDQTRSEYEQKMMSDPNGAVKWRQGWDDVMAKKQKEIDAREMSGTLRDQTNLYVKGFSGKQGISVSHRAHTTILENARDSVSALATDARIRGDFDGSDAHWEEAHKNGLVKTPEFTAQKLANARGREKQEVDNFVLSDPYAAEFDFATRKFNTPTERDNAIKQAKQRQDYLENDATDELYNKIAGGEDVTDEEIDDSFHPEAQVAIASVKKHRREYNDLTTKAKRATPQYQERVNGELHRLTVDLDVSQTGFQEERRKVANLIEQITDESTKAEWKRVLSRIDAREPKFQTAADKAIAKLHADKTLKKPELAATKVTFMEYLRDGHLGEKSLKEVTNLKPRTISLIARAARQGKYTEAIKLYGSEMRRMGRGGFKEGIKPWQKDFFIPLTNERMPTLTSTSHVKDGTPEQVLKLERDRQIYSARIARVKEGLAGRIAGRNVEDIPAEEMDTHVRELLNTFSPDAIRDIIEEDEAEERKANKINVNYQVDGFRPDKNTRIKNWENGEMYVSLDSNQAEGVPVTQPLVVLPKEAPPELRQAATLYTELMLEIHREEFGRDDFKARVVTSGDMMDNGKPWRGSHLVTHLEGFAITDEKMVAFLQTPRGKARYRQVLNKSFGNVYGVTLGLPHSATDGGAEGSGTNEVSLTRYLLGDTQPEGGEPSQPTQVQEVDKPKNYRLKPARVPYTPKD